MGEEAQTLARIHPSQPRFACGIRSFFNGSATPAQSPGPAKTRQVPRGPLPGQGATFSRVASGTTSESITSPSTLIRPHAPDQDPPAASGCPLVGGSLQVAASPCWEMALPDVISADLSLGAWTPTPVVPMVHLLVSSHGATASPALGPGRLPTNPRTATSVRLGISRLQSFTNVQAPRFARPPGRSHRPHLSAWRQPGLLRPGTLRFVTSPHSGYASRPNRATDGMGTLTPQDPQPCRLLP
jgi:hypothetical protein